MASYLQPSLTRSFRRPIVTWIPSFSPTKISKVISFAFLRRNSSNSNNNLGNIDKPSSSVETRGYSIENDLRSLINHPKFSDIEILCKHKTRIHGCKAILAARSTVFEKLLYKDENQNQFFFPNIDSYGMEIILEYIYTGSFKEELLTKNNIIETYHAANHFNLSNIRDFIFKILKNNLERNYDKNYSPELLSKAVEITDDDVLLNLLVKALAIIPLNNIKYGRLSIAGLQYLLSCTHKKEYLFATSEYDVFRYTAILAAKQVSDDAYNYLTEKFQILEKKIEEAPKHRVWSATDRKKVVKILEPLIEFIDFKRIKGQILTDIIVPLKIIPTEIIESNKAISNHSGSDLNDTRGIPISFNSDYVWDESACGPDLIIKNNGKVVKASGNYKYQNVRAKMALGDEGIFEWDVIIERFCEYSYVGVCASENFNYDEFAGNQLTGWMINTGHCYNSGDFRRYGPVYTENGTKITVHLDMNRRTCAFTIDGIKYPEVPGWDNLPSKLYPVVSLCGSAQCRILPHIKRDL
ncbi:hypothetical protein C1645_828270 [Glomus cerebriforme]|uniref:BTB domain-containing protein n=1 Tax=Glomus cerebriforme TaxID=658196 RepID=A0A397SLU2_9GLOM|nr:hypothetical protein C1645_828270 [Glomus cerebriforme]